jgi:hypothetical protein
MIKIQPTHHEIILASNLVDSQFRAICEVLDAAQHDWAPPVEPTLNTIFCFSEPAFRDHISEAFADAAQERVPFFGFWERSCHQSVRAAGNQIKRLLLPDREEFDISFDAVDRVRIAEEVTPERYREYFEASIPPAVVEKIKANWGQSKAKICALGVSGYEGVEFALQRELAQAKRDLHSAVRPADDPVPPQSVDPLDEFRRKAPRRFQNLLEVLLNHPGLHTHKRVEQWYHAGKDKHFPDRVFTDLIWGLGTYLEAWGRKSGYRLIRVDGRKHPEAKVGIEFEPPDSDLEQ